MRLGFRVWGRLARRWVGGCQCVRSLASTVKSLGFTGLSVSGLGFRESEFYMTCARPGIGREKPKLQPGNFPESLMNPKPQTQGKNVTPEAVSAQRLFAISWWWGAGCCWRQQDYLSAHEMGCVF